MPVDFSWAWLALGAILLIAELFISGVFLVWMGLSALVTGLVTFGVPTLGFGAQAIIFSSGTIVTVALVIVFGTYRRRGERITTSSRFNAYLGVEATLVEPIRGGHGRIRLDATTWRVSGPELDAGTKVVIISVENGNLQVMPVGDEAASDEGTKGPS